MKLKRHQIGYRLAAILIIVCLVLPIGVKFVHTFSHHDHEVCLGANQAHFHEIDLDCDFNKFKIHHQLFFSSIDYDLDFELVSNSVVSSYYSFLNSNESRTSHLRGPPVLM